MVNFSLAKKKRREKKEKPSWKFTPMYRRWKKKNHVSISFFAALVFSGRRQPRSSPGPNHPGGARARFLRFVTVPRGKTTKAVFTDVRGAAKEDVFIGLSMSASLFFMLFVRCPSVFTSHRLCNTTRVLSNEARSRHPAAGDMDYLLVLNRLE